LDESIFPIAPYITRGWFKRYSKPEMKYEHKRKERHCVFGAVSESNTIYSFTERFNSDTFRDFLLKLVDMLKKIVIVIDHASYHVSHKMQEFYADHKDTVHVEYFPSYSPKLNPAEQPWRAIKKWLSMRCWDNKDELKEQIELAFQQDFVNVPIYEYLRV